MTVYLDLEEERIDDIKRGLIEQALRASQATVQLSELPREESSRIERTKIAGATLAKIPSPKFDDRLSLKKVTEAPAIQSRVTQAANNISATSPKSSGNSIFDLASEPVLREENKTESSIKARLSGESLQSASDVIDQLEHAKANLEDSLPILHSDQEIVDALHLSNEETVKKATPSTNLALEIVKLGLAMETFQTENKLNKYKMEGDECKAKIDTLLKLSAQLPKMNSDDGSYELKEEVKLEIGRIAEELRAKGIDIFPGMEVGGAISKEQLASASSLINHHIDANKTNLQELFISKISVSIQFLQMMTDVMKKCIEYDDRMKRETFRK